MCPNKTLKPAVKQELATYIVQTFSLSVRQARRVLSLSRTFIIIARTQNVMTHYQCASAGG
uniref:Uncharacterized protein n=1 Tax=Erwinia amylovora ATCC BAA-2158 TaxID=889211 RepID=E5B6V8_ERWAM|nr:hypothetical protein predicted by Glimmer/Critica [Erwinia amylovora ATCC BAA-2158]